MRLKTLVVGIGNELRGDDAIGLCVVAELRSRWTGRADLRAVDGDLLAIADVLGNYGKLVIIDALPPGESPGRLEVTLLGPEPLPGRKIYSLHDMDLLWQLRLIAGSFAGTIVLIGIETQSTACSIGLSQDLAGKLPLLVEEAAKVIERFATG